MTFIFGSWLPLEAPPAPLEALKIVCAASAEALADGESPLVMRGFFEGWAWRSASVLEEKEHKHDNRCGCFEYVRQKATCKFVQSSYLRQKLRKLVSPTS